MYVIPNTKRELAEDISDETGISHRTLLCLPKDILINIFMMTREASNKLALVQAVTIYLALLKREVDKQ
jgi:hypothetical protein